MRGHVIGLSLAVALGACGGTAKGPAKVTADKDTKKATAKNARSTAREVYRAVRKGRASNMQTLLSDDAFVLGPTLADVYATRADTVVAATDRFEMADRHRVQSRGLVAVSSPSGKSAWIADQVDLDGARYTLAAVLAQVDEIWYAVAVHLGRAADTPAAETLPDLPGGVDDSAREVVELVRAGAAEPAQFLKQLADHWNVAVLGPTRRDMSRGPKRIARLWKRRKIAKQPIELLGEVRAGATADGVLAWVAANTRTGEAAPRRIFWIYERTEDGWRLVLMQWATPKPESK